MKKLVFLWVMVAMVTLSFAETVTWTGSSNSDFRRASNWSPHSPRAGDDVVIPAGSPFCELDGDTPILNSFTNYGYFRGSDRYWGNGAYVRAHSIQNHGTMGGPHPMMFNAHEGDFINDGEIRATHKISIFAGNVVNNFGASINGAGSMDTESGLGAGVYIHATDQVTNWGEIAGIPAWYPEDNGSDIKIEAKVFNNQHSGVIRPGDGASEAPGGNLFVSADIANNWGIIKAGVGGRLARGGDLDAYAKWLFENYGAIFGGDGGYGGEAGDIRIISTNINNRGTIHGFSDGGKIETPLHYFGNEIYLIGDSIEIHPEDSTINTPNYFFAIGRKVIVYDINVAAGFRASFRGSFITTPDGVLDFSGITVENAINCNPGDIWLKTDSIIAPPGGLDFIMTPAPMTTGPDTTIVDGHIGISRALSDTGDADTLKVNVQNLSTATKTLIYSVTSVLGWVTPATGMFFGVAPFATDSLDVVFNIPTDAYEGQTDTVMAVLSIDPDFAETTYSLITVQHGVIHYINALLVEPVDLNTDGKVITTCDSQCLHWHLEVPEECVVENAVIVIDTVAYYLDSPEVSLLGDDLFFCPGLPWTDGDSIEFCLAGVIGTEATRLSAENCGWMRVDLSPPIISDIEPSPNDTITGTNTVISFGLYDELCDSVFFWWDARGIAYDTIPVLIDDLYPGDVVNVCVYAWDNCADYCDSNVIDTCWYFYVEAPLFTFEYDIPIGWNLLSYPYTDVILLTETFPFYTPPGHEYDVLERAYSPVYTVTAGWGFWLMSSFDTMAVVTSTSEIDTIDYSFYPGWNIFGPPAFPVSSTKFEDFPEVLLPTFGYDPLLRSYFIADTLYPGSGYWILSLDTLEFVLPE